MTVKHLMVIGAGDTSEKTARALLSRGARSIIVSNRSHERAAALARELGGRAVHFDNWAAEFARVDIVISSTAAPHHILDRATLERLMENPALDLCVFSNYRYATLKTFPYGIVFRVEEDTIHIDCIRHHSRHPRFGFGRK